MVISGEQQESDGTLDRPEYVPRAVTLGINKRIMLGHVISEESGMLEMAQGISESSRKSSFSS